MENKNSKINSDHDMEYERQLLASPEDDAIVNAAEIKVSETSVADRIKRPATSPYTGDDKRQRVLLRNQLKIAIKRENGDVDETYFRALCGYIFDRQQQLSGDFYPTFYNSGHTQGLGWFSACDENSLSWLKTTLGEIKNTGAIKDFSVLPYAPITPLRRIILSVPHFPRLEKDGADKIMKMITRLNGNINTNYWKVSKILPPENGMRSIIMGIDEQSVTALENQGCKLFYGLGQISVKIYSKMNTE
ncbi:uncharacterized protein LOC109623423 [Aedes albopictus]|uniref:DUF4780 domain-containing protein n=1 Tax=Aedes albopictus TaxID=7160 RepID=A0ABM1XSV6_AEDAL